MCGLLLNVFLLLLFLFFFVCFFFGGGGGHVWATLRLRLSLGIVSGVGFSRI